jgi:hypothetical protein
VLQTGRSPREGAMTEHTAAQRQTGAGRETNGVDVDRRLAEEEEAERARLRRLDFPLEPVNEAYYRFIS